MPKSREGLDASFRTFWRLIHQYHDFYALSIAKKANYVRFLDFGPWNASFSLGTSGSIFMAKTTTVVIPHHSAHTPAHLSVDALYTVLDGLLTNVQRMGPACLLTFRGNTASRPGCLETFGGPSSCHIFR